MELELPVSLRLILDFWPPELEKNKLLLFHADILVVSCYSSNSINRKLLHKSRSFGGRRENPKEPRMILLIFFLFLRKSLEKKKKEVDIYYIISTKSDI